LINKEDEIRVRKRYRFMLEIFIEGNLDAKKKRKGEKICNFFALPLCLSTARR